MSRTNIDRRTFVGAMGALGALSVAGVGIQPTAAVAADSAFPPPKKGKPIEAAVDPKTGEVAVNEDVLVRYSGCVGCYSACGNRIKLDRETGSVLGVGGNPYNPACAEPFLEFEAPLEAAYQSMSYANGKGGVLHGTICGRGNGTLDATTQPDRITVPLKRAGKRGEGKWKPIGWDQLIEEVVEGGKLFAEIGEDRAIEGFKALRDVETPMNADQPDLGPKSNQVVVMNTRADGRRALNARFASAYGTLNAYSHNSSCGAAGGAYTLYQTGMFTVPDIDQTEYVVWSGSFPGANGANFQYIGKHVARRLREGTLKIDVLDPTLGSGVVTPTMPGITWVPIKPATNGALYAAIAQHMINNKTYNAEAMSCPNQKAAEAAGYGSFSNGTYLVIADEGHPNYRKLMRAADAGLAVPEADESSTAKVEHYVVIDAQTGEPAIHSSCSSALLEYEGEVNGVKVRTGFLYLADSVNERTIDEYAEITGVPAAELERMAKEYVSHGVKASIQGSAGSTASVVGFDTPAGRDLLRAMIGAVQVCGGSMPKGQGPGIESKAGPRYDLATVKGNPPVSAKNAVLISRGGKAWKKTKEYEARVAAGEKDPKPLLPWHANAPQSDSQALMSIVNQYPYQCKILMTWMCNVVQGTPGAMRDEVIERLKDPSVLPLHIVCDVVVGEAAQYADYIVPDVTQYESFGVPGAEQTGGFGTTVRWEAKRPEVMQLDDGRYACWETFLIDVAKACDLPGWGADAIPDLEGGLHPFDTVYDYYLKAVANLAYAETPVDDITEEEVRIQGLDQLHDNFKKAVRAEEWPKVLKVLSRGGRYWDRDYERTEDGRFRRMKDLEVFVYNEKRAITENPYSGKRLSPTLTYNPQMFSDLSPMTDHFSEEEYPFTASEHKPRFRSVSMLANSPIMRDVCAHNYIEMNDEDAAELGVKDGDLVRAVTPTGDVTEGEAMVRAGQVKGAFSVSFGYGHRNYGAQDVEIDGVLAKGDPAIAAGTRIVTMLDPTVSRDGVLSIIADNDAASPGRCGGMFKIEKA